MNGGQRDQASPRWASQIHDEVPVTTDEVAKRAHDLLLDPARPIGLWPTEPPEVADDLGMDFGP